VRVASVVSSSVSSLYSSESHGKHISSTVTIDFARFEGRDLDEDALLGRDCSVSLDLADSAFDDVAAACFLRA
jgi:hypothetical protein